MDVSRKVNTMSRMRSGRAAELTRLRKENRELRMERDIPKKPHSVQSVNPTTFGLDPRGRGRVPDHEALSVLAGLAKRNTAFRISGATRGPCCAMGDVIARTR